MNDSNPTSEQRATLLLNGLLKLGMMFKTEMPELLMEAYREGLSDLPEAELRMVFTRALLECKFMPTVAELRAFVVRKEVAADALQADREWREITAHVEYNLMAYGHTAPPLSDSGDYALRQIGGIEAVYDCLLEKNGCCPADLKWRGKDFREAYGRYAETGGLKAIGRDEARRMLDIAKRGHMLAEKA